MTERILLIEDDEDVRRLVEDLLVDEGYETDPTDTVAAALAMLTSRSYDLVLTDGRLPDGTGLTIAERATEQGIKVLIFTGFADQFPPDELAKYRVLRKPGDMDHLVSTVGKMLDAA
jgi:DNA-binding NtrC family response regulator